MKKHNELINDEGGLRKLCERLSKEKQIAVDTEFIREKTFFPQLEIIQIGSDKESWLLDAEVIRQSKPMSKLFTDLMRNPKILKVFHAGQADEEAIYFTFGQTVTPIIDTAIAAALCGYGDGVGLANLLSSALGVKIKKGFARSNWSLRPLPDQLKEYAHSDVEFLLNLWKKLESELSALNRVAWAKDLCSKLEDPDTYETNPEEIAERLFKSGRLDKTGYSILLELVKWRENRIRSLNIPKKWIADDSVLLDLASARPKNSEQLLTFRGLNKGEAKKQSDVIIAAIKKGKSNSEEVSVPKLKREKRLSAAQARSADLLKCFIGILASKNQIATRYIATSPQINRLVLNKIRDPDELVESCEITQGAANLAGNEILGFIHGELGLFIDHGEVKTLDISGKK